MIRSSVRYRIGDAMDTLRYAVLIAGVLIVVLVTRVVTLAVVAGLGYVANESLMPVLMPDFSLKWWGVVIVLVGTVLGMVLAHFTDAIGDFFAEPMAGSLTGVIIAATVGYFSTARPPLWHWEILVIGIATCVAVVIGIVGVARLTGSDSAGGTALGALAAREPLVARCLGLGIARGAELSLGWLRGGVLTTTGDEGAQQQHAPTHAICREGT